MNKESINHKYETWWSAFTKTRNMTNILMLSDLLRLCFKAGYLMGKWNLSKNDERLMIP